MRTRQDQATDAATPLRQTTPARGPAPRLRRQAQRGNSTFEATSTGEDSSSSSDEPPVPAAEDDDDGPPPPLRLRSNPTPAFRLTPASGAYRSSPPRSPQRSPNSSFVNVTSVPPALSPSALHVPVPFPRSSSPSSPLSPTFASAPSTGAFGSAQGSPAGGAFPQRPPGPVRTASTPVILLSNGKPLKSSLKSSSSAPHVPSHHLRARSAPSTPSLAASPPSPAGENANSWGDGTCTTYSHLATYPPARPKRCTSPPPTQVSRISGYSSAPARPASVSFPLDDETETETETDSAPRWSSGIASWGTSERASTHAHGYPFPKVAATGKSPLNPAVGKKEEGGKEWRYALNAPGVPRGVGEADMVVLEGMWLVGVGAVRLFLVESPSSSPALALEPPPTPNTASELTLHGTLLARNAAFEKHVFVRFTLDGWCTTSEVGARYVEAASHPHCASARSDGAEEPGPGWDRFAFSIRLTDYAHSHSRGARSGASTGDEKLREHGVGGIGRGVGGAGVGACGKVLCAVDTLPPTTPAAQVGTDVSPSGRAWVGEGGGGSGEWWDNNTGKDYRVGFRCVAVVQEPPAPPPTNVIPFPSAEPVAFSLKLPSSAATSSNSTSNSSSNSQPTASEDAPLPHAGPAQAHSMASPTRQPSTTSPAERAQRTQTLLNPIPPPPPPRTAHAQALAAKLGRLSLRNYAAPGGASRALSLPGGAVAPASVQKEENKKEGGEGKSEEKPAPGTQSAGGVGLYWPWGRGSSAAATVSVTTTTASASASSTPATSRAAEHDSDSASSSDDEEGSLRDAEAGRARRRANSGASFAGTETPPTSPLGAGGLLPVIEGMVSEEGEDMTPTNEKREPAMEVEAAEVPLPASPEGERAEAEAEKEEGGSLESSASSTAAGSPTSISSSETITPGPGTGSSSPAKEKEDYITAPSTPLPPPSSSYPFPRVSSTSTPPTPSSPAPSPSPPAVLTMPLLPTAADASSSLYKAFVRQWCFAGNGGENKSGGSPTKLGSLV
ncbi:CBM21 domain-containing protein [Mycena venus]|uniref:CBM21 domain-containing protein n=1 Tax=Mycena venus TaxID=2733690 RepID=A0A8H6XUY3_9AGAR|nr:CBM21 domain-containing protein [Mycena venus]